MPGDRTSCQTAAGQSLDADFSAITEAWPTLPEPIKAGILAMVKASTSNR